MNLKAYIQNLIKNGPVISEKNLFLFPYINGLGPRSRNDLGLQYPHAFINIITCLHLPTFRSQVPIVSEKSTVFNFSYRNAYVTKFDLGCKLGQGQPRVIICTNYDCLESPMLHTKFCGNRSTASGEDF